MADVKISELTALTSPDGAEELVVNDGGTTKKITITNATSAKANIASPRFTGNVAIGHTTTSGSKFAICDGGNSQIQFFPEISTDTNLTQHYDPTASAYINAETRAATHVFKTGTTTRMLINSSGNVGIGVIPNASWNSSWTALQLGATGFVGQYQSGVTDLTALGSNVWSDGTYKYIETDQAAIIKLQNGTMIFDVAASGSANAAISFTTAMTIKNNATVVMSANGTGNHDKWEFDGGYFAASNRLSTTGSTRLSLQANGSQVGAIFSSGSGTAYNTTSDYRLKENVTPMSGAVERVKLLKPCNFDWISTSENVDGFLAHEAQEVVSEAVTGTKDAMMDEEYEVTPATGDIYTAGSEAGFTEVSPAIAASPAYYDVDGNVIKAEVISQAAVHESYEAVAEVIHSADVEQPETLEEGQAWRETTPAVMGTRSVPDLQGIDQAKLVPLLTATIQELITRIEALEA